jgi:hypothetical protein
MTNSSPPPGRSDDIGTVPAHVRPLWVWILGIFTTLLYVAFLYDQIGSSMRGTHH